MHRRAQSACKLLELKCIMRSFTVFRTIVLLDCICFLHSNKDLSPIRFVPTDDEFKHSRALHGGDENWVLANEGSFPFCC